MKKSLLSLLAWCCFIGTQAQGVHAGANEWKETPNRVNLNASLSMHGSEPGYILGKLHPILWKLHRSDRWPYSPALVQH